ncbi:MAG TPA: hypothetical protein VGE66_15875 [Chitinophagaceae bacterium]
MNDDLKDILSNLNPEVDQEALMLYLQGKLTAEKQHELEQQMMGGDFESDALEGLHSVKDKQHLMGIVDQLNHDLKKKTQKRKMRSDRLKLKSDPSVWIAIVIFLLLIVISYFIIHRLLNP